MAKKAAKKEPEMVEEIQTTKEIVEDIPEEQLDKEIEKVERKMNVIGKVRNKVYQKSSFIKTKSLRSHPCNYELPDDIRKYLNNKGWGSNVYLKGEEWLVKHNADMKMIEKLKDYLSEHFFLMWKELIEINEMFTPIRERHVVDDSDVVKFQKIRVAKEYFNNKIREYLKEKHLSIKEITKKDINYLGKNYNEKDREVLIQQIMYHLETSFGKPLKRIKENDKCALFREIDNDGGINSGTKKTSNKSSEQGSIPVAPENGGGDSGGDKEADNSSSGELLSS